LERDLSEAWEDDIRIPLDSDAFSQKIRQKKKNNLHYNYA